MKRTIAEGMRRLGKLDGHLSYDKWIRRVEQPAYQPAKISQDIGSFKYRPKISLITPVYNTPPWMLEKAIRSLQAQHYDKWELCICDDASSNAQVRECLEGWQKKDARIKVTLSPENEGISEASNRALRLATGEFVGLLDHDDELSPDALYEVVKLLQRQPEADMIYSDEDKLNGEGRRVEPAFKPDWSPEYMLAMMYTCHLGVYRKQLVEEIGGFRSAFDGSQDYDLMLRLSEQTKRIYHIPKVLYHWRMSEGSASVSSEGKPYAFVAAKKALNAHLQRRGIPGEFSDGNWAGYYRIKFKLPETEKVSIVVVESGNSENLKACIASIEDKSSYRNYEIVTSEETLKKASLSKAINAGTKRASGEYFLIVHGDTEIITADWIDSMLGFCRQSEIGVVGAKLVDRGGRMRHAGVVLGMNGMAGWPLWHAAQDTWNGRGVSCATRNCSAVSAACMMVRRSVFEEAGGFDERLTSAYSELDFCLKVREAGYRIVWTPWAELYHENLEPPNERKSAGDIAYLKKRWGNLLMEDPFYNPNFTVRHGDFGYRL